MRILRGRYADHTATLHQFANDWMAVDLTDGRQGVIVRPDQVQLDPEEHARVTGSAHVGQFWAVWQLNDDGTFTSLVPRRSRRTPRTRATATSSNNQESGTTHV